MDNETTPDTTPKPSFSAELFGGLFGAILVGTMEDHSKK